MPGSDAEKWDTRYRTGGHDRNTPARVLADFQHLLPEKGTALDLACGTGANAMLLAKKGLDTTAWDISVEALKKLSARANAAALNIRMENRDVVTAPPSAETFDVIVVSYFLERDLFPYLIDALRTGGLLFYQTFIRDKTDETGPGNPVYLLAVNELLCLCASLRILYYHEEGTVGNTKSGFRNEAMLIGLKDQAYVRD